LPATELLQLKQIYQTELSATTKCNGSYNNQFVTWFF